MHKYATATALAIALNIMMLALAVSASLTPASAWYGTVSNFTHPPNERGCDSWWADNRVGAIGCHCSFGCRRQYSYIVRSPCLHRTPPFCDRTMYPVETVHTCIATCVKAKEAARH
jgi:hypothetical protein